MTKRPIYVVDTNILIDYPNIIPTTDSNDYSKDPTINLDNAHLVIPTAVIRELMKFDEEPSGRGKSARLVLTKLREIFDDHPDLFSHSGYEEEDEGYDWSFYRLARRPTVTGTNIVVSILPVAYDFKYTLKFQSEEDTAALGDLIFQPADTDMGGQIILAALVVMHLEKSRDIVLITNNNGLALRAMVRGIKCSRYGYTRSEPYTGRRDLAVPKDLFYSFWHDGKVSRVDFEDALPNERPLIANEFIVMSLEDPRYYPNDFQENCFDHIAKYDAKEDALVRLKYCRNFPVYPMNAGQAIYAEALMDPNVSAVICFGPAGSGKTYMATIYGYNACKDGDFIGVTVVPCEHSSNIGALPGDLEEKIDPNVQPLKNALRNYLLDNNKQIRKDLENHQKFGANNKPSKQAKKASTSDNGDKGECHVKTKVNNNVENIWKNWFDSIPIEYARGRDFSYEIAIYDEFQDQNRSQADTLIKRIGTNGKIILTGDIKQIHSPYLDENNNGLTYASDLLINNPMVAQLHFNEDEVVRHPLVKMVAERQKS